VWHVAGPKLYTGIGFVRFVGKSFKHKSVVYFSFLSKQA
jgi:hypothetical protein